MTGIVAHTYPEWRLKLAGQVAHWSTDYSESHLPFDLAVLVSGAGQWWGTDPVELKRKLIL